MISSWNATGRVEGNQLSSCREDDARLDCPFLSKRIGRPLTGKFDESLDSSCPGRRCQFGDPIDREVG